MGTDKALQPFCGQTLLSHSALMVKPLSIRILISSDQPAHTLPGCERIGDLDTVQGPLSGLISCLLHTSTTCALVVSIDMPLITSDDLFQLFSFESLNHAWCSRERNFPLPALLSTDIRMLLQQQYQTGERRLYAALQAAGVRFVPAPQEILPHLLNCNTPEELKNAERIANNCP